MEKEIINIEGFNNLLTLNEAVLVYFSHEECNVCKVMLPKVKEMIENQYPKIKFQYINVRNAPEVAAQLSVFTVPTILVYFMEREYIRKSRHIGIGQLNDEINRPYNLIFK